MREDDKPEVKVQRRTALKANTVREMVYQSVLRKIQRDEIGPNDRVLDYEIAIEFGCTRMPVRQALIRLVSDGYLIGTTRGFVIPTMTEMDAKNIFEVRRLLEPAAAASAVEHLTAADLNRMTSAWESCVHCADVDDAEGFARSSYTFREVWLGAIPNDRLQTQVLRFSDHAMKIRRRTLLLPSMMRVVLVDLEKLYQAFLHRDTVMVSNITLRRLQHAESVFRAAVSKKDVGE